MSSNSLSMHDIYKHYFQSSTQIAVLKGICATFTSGHSYAITGASGSGKSTLIHILAGLDMPSSGTIFFNGSIINTYNENQKSRFLNKSLGLVFQYPYLIKELTVLENVAIKGLIGGNTTYESNKKAAHLLDCVGLASKIDGYPGQLSGGQQQRVALARALMNQPDFLLADEPTGNLDEQIGTAIIDLILKLQQEWSMGIIISSHDAYVAKCMQTLFELKDGLLIQR